MRFIAVLLMLGLAGCSQDRAHRDCDRTLVPINGPQGSPQGDPAVGPEQDDESE